MKPRRVVITINEIVLHGFDQASAATATALKRELVWVFSERPLAARQGAEIAHVSAPAMALPPHAPPRALAAGLAERIHGGVAAAGRPPRRGA
jgi:hypothetical protein